MNNPLEAVTQAVNSLVTALKLPDESAKANEVLGEMSFPQFSRLLPYRDYNQESGLFMNDTTMGFMLEAIPINGANESIVEALDHMLRTKLPRGIPLCIHLMSSQLVGDRIEYGLREFSWSGEQAERFNAITRAYYMKAAATQFPLPEGMNLPLTLRHYRVFISYCSPSKKKSRADILEMENLVKIIRASLQGASITTQTVDAQAFIDIVGEMINHNPDSLYPKRRQLDPYSDLNYQCVEDSFDLKVRADYLTLGLRENGRNSTARILNFHLARNPEIAFLWNVADNYSNLLNPELSISCPFILTLTLVVEDQVKTHSEANLKYMDLEKKSKTSYAKWFPSVEKEAKEWGELRQRLGSGQSSVVSYFLNITAFCKDNNETALEVEQDILNSFRKNGFELISPRFNHMRNFLTCLPFMAGKGLFKQLKEAGVVQRAESFNVANLMPLVADIKVSQGKVPDTANPSMPIQICPAPPPLFRRIGLAIGYWEPMALTDVTRSPGCMVNLGFSLPAFGKTAQGTAKKDEKQVNGAFYHVHWYKYPLTYWLNIITSLGCLEGGDLDIAYLSEIDPTWTDSSLTTILNPEAVIFANPIAQGACAADAIASAFNMPLDVLFWCAGSQGSMYPFNGWVSNESSPLQSSLLVSERMAFKLHRQGMIMETIGKNNAVCNEYPSPILPKERWRYQMVNMYPDSGQCHPFGRSVTRWETGKNPPNTKKNFGYLMWRKRNCVFL
ncbi:TPA: conjugal transfer pilus assembly protein TraU [Klebsiella pneumoniae]|nr:conjugal transfer pilus assembly protein TraU [Klebsiella pneumoniae]